MTARPAIRRVEEYPDPCLYSNLTRRNPSQYFSFPAGATQSFPPIRRTRLLKCAEGPAYIHKRETHPTHSLVPAMQLYGSLLHIPTVHSHPSRTTTRKGEGQSLATSLGGRWGKRGKGGEGGGRGCCWILTFCRPLRVTSGPTTASCIHTLKTKTVLGYKKGTSTLKSGRGGEGWGP